MLPIVKHQQLVQLSLELDNIIQVAFKGYKKLGSGKQVMIFLVYILTIKGM